MRLKSCIISLAVSSLFCNLSYAEDLMDIYKEAYVKDTTVLAAKAQRDTAFEKISEATAALLPKVDVIGSVKKNFTETNQYTGVNSNNTVTTGAISLSQSLWRHSSWKNRTIAEKNAAQQDLVYNSALQYLIVRVSNAYFGVLNAQEMLTYTKANQNALKTQLNETKRRFDVGLIAETDVLEAQAAYDLATARVIQAENQLENSYSEIRKIIGRDVRNLHKLNEAIFSPLKLDKTLDTVIKNAEENNLSLQAAIIARDISKESITLARTGFEPTIDLVGQYAVTDTKFDNQIPNTQQVDDKNKGGSVGITVNIPLFSGGSTLSQVEQAKYQYVVASEQLEATHRQVLTDVSNGYNNVSAAISSVIAYEQTTKSSESALKATQAGYEVGTRTISDVLNATQNLYNAKQNLAQARFSYIISRLNLLYSQGLLKVSDIEQVNSGLIK